MFYLQLIYGDYLTTFDGYQHTCTLLGLKTFWWEVDPRSSQSAAWNMINKLNQGIESQECTTYSSTHVKGGEPPINEYSTTSSTYKRDYIVYQINVHLTIHKLVAGIRNPL